MVTILSPLLFLLCRLRIIIINFRILCNVYRTAEAGRARRLTTEDRRRGERGGSRKRVQ